MSTAGIASIALFAPIVASNAVFSARRAKRGADAMDNNPLFGLANFEIAAAQILKGGRAAKALSVATESTTDIAAKGAKETIKSTSVIGKTLKGAGKVISFTADHINPIIVATGAIKVLGSEDKPDALARETTSLACMFGAEAAMKDFVGMPTVKKVNGKLVTRYREGSYNNLFKNNNLFKQEQLKAMKDFFAVEKKMAECTNIEKFKKVIPGTAKGLLFVGASIAGYEIGSKIADKLLGKKKEA